MTPLLFLAWVCIYAPVAVVSALIGWLVYQGIKDPITRPILLLLLGTILMVGMVSWGNGYIDKHPRPATTQLERQ